MLYDGCNLWLMLRLLKKVREVIRNLGNVRIWANGMMFLLSTLPAYVGTCIATSLHADYLSSYAFSYFLVLILRGFGYSVRDSQLLSAPPYITVCLSIHTRMRKCD